MDPWKKLQYALKFREPQFNLNWFICGCIGLSSVAWLLNTIRPEGEWVVGTGILLISGTFFCFINSVLNNVRRTIIVTSGVVGLLILRALKLYDVLYYLILAAFIISLCRIRK